MNKEKTIRFAIYLSLLCGIYLLGYQVIFNNVIKKELINKKTELYAYSKVLKEKQETLDEFNKLAAIYKKKRDILLKYNNILLEDEKKQTEILSYFYKITAKNKVSMEGYNFGEFKSGGDKVGALQVNITIKGTYSNFKNFVRDLSFSLPLMEVETMTLSSMGGDKLESFPLQLIIYTKNVPAVQSQTQQSEEEKKKQNETLPTEGQNF